MFIKRLSIIVSAILIHAPSFAQSGVTVDNRYTDEIKNIAAHPLVQSAFKAIADMDKQTIADLITLTQIQSAPFKEQKRGEKYKQMLKAAGVDSIWTDKAGNVIALRKGLTRKKVVVIEAHLDTVFPEGTDVTVKKRSDTLFAPGIGDDTRGLTVVLTMLKAMNKVKLKTDADVYFIGTVGEEGLGDLRGVKQLFNSGMKIDSYISVDGGELGDITYGAVGSRRYRVTYKGEGGHSYGAFGLANPHNATARAIQSFIIAADALTRSGAKTTYNIGKLGGGTSVNAIPFESWMEVDMRSESAESLHIIDSLFLASVQKALKEENNFKRIGKDLTADIQLVGDRPTGTQPISSAIVQRAAAASLQLGVQPKYDRSSTNANIPISKNISAVTIWSGGKADGAHSLHEWWKNDNGAAAIQAALLLLLSEAGVKQ